MSRETDSGLEVWKAQVQSEIEGWKYQRAFSLQWDRGAFEFAAIAVRSVILVNGGAAVALLAFLAHLWTSPGNYALVIQSAFTSLSEFVVGVTSGVIASLVGYAATYLISGALQTDKEEYTSRYRAFIWSGVVFQFVAAVLIVYALLRFWWGVSAAGRALTTALQ